MPHDYSRRKIAIFTLIISLGIVIIISSVFFVYESYKNQIVDQQREQIITTAETASLGLEYFFQEKKQGMDIYFDGMMSTIPDKNTLYKQIDTIIERFYFKEKNYLYNIKFIKAEEISSAMDNDAKLSKNAEYGDYKYIAEGLYILYLSKTIYINGHLEGYVMAGIDLNKVYHKILFPVQIGERGYCTVKDQNGMILMHGTKSQIGINSKTDRKELYPKLNAKGIDTLLNNQLSGKSGSDIVTSYWWDDVESGPVTKIIGYTPVSIVEGNTWVVSVIMDYAEIAGPIHNALSMSIILGFILVVFFGTLVYFITKEWKNTERIKLEWKYENELREAANALRKQEAQVRQYDKLQTLGILSGTIAHEFNNLMTPILIYCDLLLPKFKEDEEVKEEIEEISSIAQRCSELSKQLLAYGRVEKDEDLMSIYDGTLVAKNSMRMIAKLIPREINLDYRISEEPIMLYGNAGSLNQILLNLCTNAYQAMKETGGSLQVSFYKKDEEEAILKVSDTGCGMDKETMARMYQAFFTTKESGEGTGLGLSVVKRLVTKQGGNIEATSKLGEGTTFTIVMPIKDMKPKENNLNENEIKAVAKKKIKIMILDDNDEILKSMEKGLSITNWHIEYSTNPSYVFGRLKEQSNGYDILLTDESMPEMSGLELSAILKKVNPAIKIIIMTGYVEKNLQENVNNKAIDGFLLKPISAMDVIREVFKLI
jgi:signal transduction histidine kinase